MHANQWPGTPPGQALTRGASDRMAAVHRCTALLAQSLTAQPARHEVATGRCRSAGGYLTICLDGGTDPHGRARLTAATHIQPQRRVQALTLSWSRQVHLGSRGAAIRRGPTVHSDLADDHRLDWLSSSFLGRSLRPHRDRAAHRWRLERRRRGPHPHPATRTARRTRAQHRCQAALQSASTAPRPAAGERACAAAGLRLRRVRRRPPQWRPPCRRPLPSPAGAGPGPAPLTTAGPRRGACARTPPRRRPEGSAR